MKADDNLAKDVEILLDGFVERISKGDDDKTTLVDNFEDYMELHKCSTEKGKVFSNLQNLIIG